MFCGSCEDIIDPDDFLDQNEKRMRKHRSGHPTTKTKHKTNVFVHKHTIKHGNDDHHDGESTMADEDDDESTMMDDGSRSNGSNSTNNNNEKKKKKVRRSDSMNVDMEDDGDDGRSENSTSVGSTNVGSSMLDDNVSNVSTNASSIFDGIGRNHNKNNGNNKNNIKKYNNNNNGSTENSANDGNKNKNSCYQPLLDDRSSLGSIGSSGGVHPASPAKAAQATKALKVAKAAIAAKAAQRQAIINNKSTHKKKETEAHQQQQEEQGWPPPLSPATITKEQESLALQALLRGGSTGTATTTKDFFDRVYQTKCALFPCSSKGTEGGEKNDDDNKQHTNTPPKTTTTTTAADDSDDNTTNTADLLSTAWNESRMRSSPFEECIQQGWNILVHLLDELKLSDDDDDDDHIIDEEEDDDDDKHNSLHDSDNKMDSRIEQQMKQIIQPMFFKGQSPVLEDDDDVDGGNGKLRGFRRDLFKAYLDGCNIICNHADLSSPWISLLCEDLQRSFPHVFANAYLTPPGSQAVKPHSDDRDVFVIQLTGAKHWKVYQRLPIPYPYTEEQVGKERLVGSSKPLKVPSYVLDGPLLVDAVLQPGDVLYMPRGYVHEARGVPFANNGSGISGATDGDATNGKTTTTQPSFHITIALATHDWTLGKLMTQATEEILLSSSTHMLRKAISRSFGRYTNSNDGGGSSSGFISNNNNNENGMNNNHSYDTLPSLQDQQNLQAQIDTAFSILKQKITSQAIHGMLQTKYSKHNQQAYYFRKRLLDKITKRQQQAMMNTTTRKSNKKNNSSIAGVVGIRASRTVTLRTVIRIATEHEKTVARTMMLSSQHQQQHQQRVGLQVREEIAEGIIHILTELKKNPRAHYEVGALRYALLATNPNNNNDGLICDLALLSFVKQCVAQGAVAVV